MKTLDRNKCVECGPIFCEGCGLFFDDNRKSSIFNYRAVGGKACEQHKGKAGYSLLERIEHEELQARV